MDKKKLETFKKRLEERQQELRKIVSRTEQDGRAAMQAEREAIERVLAQTRWNRRQAAKILRVSYKALLNKLKAMEEGKIAKSPAEEAKVNSKQQPA